MYWSFLDWKQGPNLVSNLYLVSFALLLWATIAALTSLQMYIQTKQRKTSNKNSTTVFSMNSAIDYNEELYCDADEGNGYFQKSKWLWGEYYYLNGQALGRHIRYSLNFLASKLHVSQRICAWNCNKAIFWRSLLLSRSSASNVRPISGSRLYPS